MFFNPDPYLKMCIHPGEGESILWLHHHGQITRTSISEATVDPNWSGKYHFIAYPSDMIVFEVKDKFARSRPSMSRFLGRVKVPVNELLERYLATPTSMPFEASYRLNGKNSSSSSASSNANSNFVGSIFFTFSLEKGTLDPRINLRQKFSSSELHGSPSISPFPFFSPASGILGSHQRNREENRSSRSVKDNSRSDIIRQVCQNRSSSLMAHPTSSPSSSSVIRTSTSNMSSNKYHRHSSAEPSLNTSLNQIRQPNQQTNDIPPPLPPKQKLVSSSVNSERSESFSKQNKVSVTSHSVSQTAHQLVYY